MLKEYVEDDISTNYPKKPLIEKLGIKEGFKIITLNPPEDYSNTLGKMPKSVFVTKTLLLCISDSISSENHYP